jgi:hypothetical protein
MAMSYTSLAAAKGVSGSIATWINYTLLDTPTVIDEAQALIYGEGRLRTREMMTSFMFTMPVNSGYTALPARFLDPIGKIRRTSFNDYIRHKDGNFVELARNYTETNGTLAANALTTTANSNSVNVNLPVHGFAQDSPFNLTGATAFNGITPNGTFPINAIVDANNFTIDISILGTTPSGSGTGGGAAMAYLCDSLTIGTPDYFGIWDERINFDQAFSQTSICRLQYYQSLPLLSSTNATNFLTNRYPNLMRIACMAAAADFMKDDTEYQKQFQRLAQMITSISAENDMQYRGLELDPAIP